MPQGGHPGSRDRTSRHEIAPCGSRSARDYRVGAAPDVRLNRKTSRSRGLAATFWTGLARARDRLRSRAGQEKYLTGPAQRGSLAPIAPPMDLQSNGPRSKKPQKTFSDSPVKFENGKRVYPKLGIRGGPRVPASERSLKINALLATLVKNQSKLIDMSVPHAQTNFYRALRYMRLILFRHSIDELKAMTEDSVSEYFLENYEGAFVWERENKPQYRNPSKRIRS